MFKKLLIILLVFSPIIYSFIVGFPIVGRDEFQARVKELPNASVSKRCFAVGDFREFTICMRTNQRISAWDLIREITNKTDKITPVFTYISFLSVIGFIILGVSILFE